MLKKTKEKICNIAGRLAAGWRSWWWAEPEAEVLAGLARLRDSVRD